MPNETFFNLPDDKRQRILDVAIDEFAENDYPNVSISRLVDRAGIAKGSFYQYFEDKEDLFRHLMDIAAREKQAFLSEPQPDPQMDIFAYLNWLMREGLRFEFAHPRLSQVGYRAITGSGYPPGFIKGFKEQGMAYFRQLVALGKAQGVIASLIDDDLAAFLFNTIFTELGQYIIRRYPDLAPQAPGDAGQFHAFFETREVQNLLAQTVAFLEHGFGRGSSTTEQKL
jgi:TetR/AcrR family transcriptional regulator